MFSLYCYSWRDVPLKHSRAAKTCSDLGHGGNIYISILFVRLSVLEQCSVVHIMLYIFVI